MESGFIAEIVVEAAMRNRRNIWIDGSLRDTGFCLILLWLFFQRKASEQIGIAFGFKK
jgi:hypothetical protein